MKLIREDYSLCEWLIRTFTNENMYIFDNCMESGTTGIATLNVGEGRRFIGIELKHEFFNIAKNRIEDFYK